MYRRYIIFDFEYSKRHTLAQDFSPPRGTPACKWRARRSVAAVAAQAHERYGFFDGPLALRQTVREGRAGAQAAGWRDFAD
ncbi:hypothetical protein ACVCNH_27640 [Achromobacter anxifer]